MVRSAGTNTEAILDRGYTTDHAGASGVDIASGDATETFEVGEYHRELRIAVSGAAGNFTITVELPNATITLQTGASDDVVENVPLPVSNDSVTVRLSDDSGASNAVDYDFAVV